jgi:hypothetical protein
MPRRSLALVALLLVSPLISGETLTPPKISGIYSDLTYNAEAGDLIGMEILILPRPSDSNPAWSAFVQIAEGGAPYSAVVPLTIKGSEIELTLPPGGTYGGLHFSGTISKTGLLIRWDSGQQNHLKRGKSYWQ